MPGPYSGRPKAKWPSITRELVDAHPLDLDVILDASLTSWGNLWATRVGAGAASVPLDRLSVPSTVIGYFFEVLLARELELRYPGIWRGTAAKGEKDLVYVPDPSLSVEVKASGQMGYRVYGNRSYGQELVSRELAKKEKSGYYITVNFVGTTLTLLRFGWIDAHDWRPQASQTGQMAGLPTEVYTLKLVSIPGAYRSAAPVGLLSGVGPRLVESLAELGVTTIAELIEKESELPARMRRILEVNRDMIAACRDRSE